MKIIGIAIQCNNGIDDGVNIDIKDGFSHRIN